MEMDGNGWMRRQALGSWNRGSKLRLAFPSFVRGTRTGRNQGEEEAATGSAASPSVVSFSLGNLSAVASSDAPSKKGMLVSWNAINAIKVPRLARQCKN